MKNLPIGISDFSKLIKGDYYYVDKTLLIKEILESSGEVQLIPRPRRFGKTLNLSMLKYFFEKTDHDNSALFTHTKIWQDENYRKHQGKYPVIYLTFKDVKEEKWEIAYKKIVSLISREFERHIVLAKKHLSAFQLNKYTAIIEERADLVDYHNSLFILTKLLHEAYNEQVIVLIDEYDAPIHAGYAHGYYQDTIQFMRSFLTPALKDNDSLNRGILTGILRTAKEGIFSGLNNLKVYSLLNNTFQDKFGFTQQEVERLFNDFNLSPLLDDAQQWYNGYTFGSTTIYNPWSLLMCISEQGAFQPYWVNTSDNLVIKKLLTLSDIEVKTDFELLLSGKSVAKVVDEAIIFPGIEKNDQALWSLFLFTGYLTYTSCELNEGITTCSLTIPNKEIKFLYNNFIKEIVQGLLKTAKVTTFVKALTTGDVETFGILLQEFVLNSISFYDLPINEAEKSYHLFVLGLLALLADSYQIKSNRESGHGRYDIMLIPHDKNNLGIVIEFKKATEKETLEIAAQRALEQINNKKYAQELIASGIKHIKAYGIAFKGKDVLVLAEDLK
jgi:hypothetical protein